jgi:hypothetical protein
MFVTMRTYRIRSGSIDALMHRVERDPAEGLRPGAGLHRVSGRPHRPAKGRVDHDVHEPKQAVASNELAAEWVSDALADFDVERKAWSAAR